MADEERTVVVVDDVDDLELGTAVRVEVDELRICLARTAEGEVFAVDDTCTHEEEPLSRGWVEGRRIECAAHNSIFDLETGEAVRLPAEDPLTTYPVTIRGSEVHLTLPYAT